jgi:hypothetical protein
MPSALRSGPVALVALLVLATAAPAAGADDKATRDAQARFAEGLARVKSGDYEAARISFAQAYVVLHKPDILWNLALAEEKSGHSLEALRHFKELTSTAAADTDRANAQKHVAVLMAQMGHIDVTAPSGTLLTVDGVQNAGSAPLAEPIDVTPGKHVVEGKLAEGTKSATVDAVAGETAHVTLVPDAPSTGTGTGTATSTPTSTSTSTPTPTATATSTPPGADTTPVSTARLVTTASLGAAAVLSLGAGAYFGFQSQSDASNASQYRSSYPSNYCVNPTGSAVQTCSAWNDAVKAQNRDATLSNVFYVTGGVLAVGAIATWFLWPREATGASSAWVVPSVGPAGGGVVAGGRF